MNCLEFRRRIVTDPSGRDETLLAHAAACSSCAAFERRSRRFEALLGRAVRVEVPEDLAARVLLRHDFETARPRSMHRRSLALAASVLLLLAVGGLGWWFAERSDPLAEEILSFVETATFALESDHRVSQEQLRVALRPAGVHLNGPIGDVTFAGPCVVQGRLAGHIVLQGRTDKITVLLVPDLRLSRSREFEGHARNGLLVPAEAGLIAIVAAPDEPLQALARRVLGAVQWSS